jgi:predicted DCC family thiol-disulfide oxidoreductase YuxK
MKSTIKDEYRNIPVILFDGECNLCSSSVEFVIKRNAHSNIVFCQLQSERGQQLLSEYNLQALGLNSMILLYRGKSYIRSSAAIHTAMLMDKPWPLMGVFLLVPPVIRHTIYDWIGRRRYQWYGKKACCWIPDEDIKSRFLS